MARTRTTRRRGNSRSSQAAAAKQPKNIPTHSRGIGVKRMRLTKRQTAKWKIKRLSPPPRHINVKNRGNVVRKMIVRRSAIYPDATGGNYQKTKKFLYLLGKMYTNLLK